MPGSGETATFRVPARVVRSIRKLTGMDVEVTGHLVFWRSGRLRTVLYDYDHQWVDRDAPDPDILFHTHPADYATLYPDHPSVTDVQTTHNLMCRRREVVGHLVFTPKFLYLIEGNCDKRQARVNELARRAFDECRALTPDRNQEAFRTCYLRVLNSSGAARVRRFDYPSDDGPVEMDLRLPPWRPVSLRTAGLILAASVAAVAALARV